MREIISRLQEAIGGGPFLYHGTSLQSLLTIMHQGLIPHKPPGNDPWPEFDDFDDDEDDLPEEAFEPRVFATDNLPQAKEYAENNAEPIILRIRADFADWDEGETDWPYYFTTKAVPPEQIEALFMGEWRPMHWVIAQRESGMKRIEEDNRKMGSWAKLA